MSVLAYRVTGRYCGPGGTVSSRQYAGCWWCLMYASLPWLLFPMLIMMNCALTVAEHMHFMALLRLDRRVSKQERKLIIQDLLERT
ncbi:hypothetical protein DOY81_014516, partial [Sarcophaga bullata]